LGYNNLKFSVTVVALLTTKIFLVSIILLFCVIEIACHEDDEETFYEIQAQGTVTNEAGYPLDSATVKLAYGWGGKTVAITTTDDSGKYYITGRMPCDYMKIVARKEGYHALQYPSPIMDLHYSGTRRPPSCTNELQTFDFPLKLTNY
jgi:hypothetical protein